jgi:hypothetical protein
MINPTLPNFYRATVGHIVRITLFLYWDGAFWINAKGWKVRDVTGWEESILP